MSIYQNEIKAVTALKEENDSSWNATNPKYAARMRIQSRFKTGLSVAKYTVIITRKDMAEYDTDSSVYTQSLGCWHGFIGQQKLISIKKYLKTINKRCLYLSGWIITALRSNFGPLPDQSMREKATVLDLTEELYIFLRQANTHGSDLLFTGLGVAHAAGDGAKEAKLLARIDNFEIHVVLIITGIDIGFGNTETTYLLVKKVIRTDACCIQVKNQVSDEKWCDHRDGKVTVPRTDSLAEISAVHYAFLELGVDDGVIVARTGSLGASLTKQITATSKPGDLGNLYNPFLDCEEISEAELGNGGVMIKCEGKPLCLERPVFSLFQFREDTDEDHCVLGCIISLQNDTDLLWIKTEKPHVGQIKVMVDRIREVIPNAKLVYDNSPSFNWTLNSRQQAFDTFVAEGKDVSAYDYNKLTSIERDDTELVKVADGKIHTFQRDGPIHTGIFHRLVTLSTYHTTALSTSNLTKSYFVDESMLTHMKDVRHRELRQSITYVEHQNMADSDIDDNHRKCFAGEAALEASDGDNTMNQFRWGTGASRVTMICLARFARTPAPTGVPHFRIVVKGLERLSSSHRFQRLASMPRQSAHKEHIRESGEKGCYSTRQ